MPSTLMLFIERFCGCERAGYRRAADYIPPPQAVGIAGDFILEFGLRCGRLPF